MPPVDSSNEPTPAPTPQAPKKLSFWAKLLGKKEAPAAPIAQPTSLTPEPQLDNPTPQDFGSEPAPAPAPVAGNDVTPAPAADLAASSAPVSAPDVTAPEVVESPVVEAAEVPAPVEVPAFQAEPVQPTAPAAEEPQTPPAAPPQQ